MPDYWASHSPISQPGDDALVALAALPPDIPSLHHAASQLVLHYRAEAAHVLLGRRAEIHTRYAADMLTRLLSRRPDLTDSSSSHSGGGALYQHRRPADKTVGCCRDSALLLVSLARSKGLAARMRVGFSAYLEPGHMLDHTVAELWDAAAGRWRLVDADVPADWRCTVGGGRAKVDVLDLRPGVDFQTAPQAWQLVRRRRRRGDRAGKDGEEAAGAAAEEEEEEEEDKEEEEEEEKEEERRYAGFVGAPPQLRGQVFIAHHVLHDLAALDKTELLLWEEWGPRADYTEALRDDAERRLMDEVAAVTARPDVRAEDVKSLLLRRPQLAVPETVMLYDPYALAAAPRPVDIRRAFKAKM
ncbi:hypothetical protein IF1G_06752 [Cordyceps javanica]|uniref:Transglutaminase-like domain-containing protein n=1 Tax=Cordyceps javanica TaxID=43265 RepID=A0A545UZ36_9HYPO|nr:hypothetical protein IF1G_06752 [Cordyceps javanica]TQW06617.1 transglutaminase-like superfamily domain-containing protein [Cordyceps javanica]